MLTWLLALMMTCSYVHLFWCSHASLFTCFNDRMLSCLHVLMITCPLTCMPSCLYTWTLWWLLAPIFKWFNDCMHTCIDFICLISMHMCPHFDDEMSIGSKVKWLCYRTFVQSNALMIVREYWGDCEIWGMCTWVFKCSKTHRLVCSHA